MHLLLVGLNHRSAPIELRERLAFRREQLPQTFSTLQQIGLREAAVLSTCNRVEIYGVVPELDGTVDRLHEFLCAHSGLSAHALTDRLYSYVDGQSVRHLFSVASGLDSMVLGEAEILSQVKQAYELARACGVTGKALNALFQRALNTAKAVRTETAIGRGCTSVGAASVELAGKIFQRLTDTTVLLIGAGKVGGLTLKRLTERGVREIRIMNRSADRADALASEHGARTVRFEELPAQLQQADIVISSTSAPSYLVTAAEVESALRARRQAALCLIDLGVPRNIDPAVGSLENAYLFDVDSLQALVARDNEKRQHAVVQGRQIISRKAELFLSWWQEEIIACALPSALAHAEVP